MNINQAIEVLGIYRDEGEVDLSQDLDKALTLGIEALKRFQVCRSDNWDYPFSALPGEDRDNHTGHRPATTKRLKESPLGREPKG